MSNIKPADLIIHNARVFTAADAQPWAEAVAVRGNEILFVGRDADVSAFRGRQTRQIDGNGRSLLPGFIDAHFHLAWGSQKLDGVQLYGVQTMDELAAAVHSWLAENPGAEWVAGYGLSYSLPTPDQPLTRHHLDPIVADRPLALYTYDVHSLFVNSAALRAANLTHGAPHPLANGQVIVDENGLATGELYEEDATRYIRRAMPEPNESEKLHLLQKGLALAAANGLTSIHNMDGDFAQGQLYAALEDRERLTLRVYLPYSVKSETPLTEMATQASRMRQQFNSGKLRAGAVKFFMDGVYESYTAVSVDGYPDQPQNHGEPIWPAEKFAQYAATADALGLQIFVHACGDGAVRRTLNGFEAAMKANGRRDHRHRVEHIEMIHPQDVPRFAELGVVASMQPLHAPTDAGPGDVWPQRIAPESWQHAFAWQTLRQAKSVLAFGSDWPVVSLNPLLGIHAAVNRQPWQPGDPCQGQTVADAICSYTRHAAYAEFQEHRKGQIRPGFLADLVLLSDDIFAIPQEEIAQLEVNLTVSDGRIVYEEESE